MRAKLRYCLPLAGLIVAGAVDAAESPLTIKVITSSAAGLYTSFTLVMGQHDAILIDAPFTRADAHRVVAEILDSGKKLQAVWVTHDHPDHFFGMEVITTAFPDAQVFASPAVVDDIWRSIPLKLKRWGPMLAANGPRYPVAPAPFAGTALELEGQRLEILGPMQGDHRHSTAIWIPGLSALIAGDLVFHKMHLWFGEATEEQRLAWRQSIERLLALNPAIVVAGHKLPGLADTIDALTFTHDYIVAFEDAVGKSKDSAELRARMQARFPDTQDVFDDFLLGTSSQVAMGEIPPWQE